MTFRFGMVVGMKEAPELRALVLAQAADTPTARWFRETWWAVVLVDEDNPKAYGWRPGEIVSLSPTMSGVVVYGEEG